MLPVSRLVFAESDAEADEFYSAACTALAHGVGTCRALLHNGRPVCTVGCYEQSDTESYMAAGVTDPAWQGTALWQYPQRQRRGGLPAGQGQRVLGSQGVGVQKAEKARQFLPGVLPRFPAAQRTAEHRRPAAQLQHRGAGQQVERPPAGRVVAEQVQVRAEGGFKVGLVGDAAEEFGLKLGGGNGLNHRGSFSGQVAGGGQAAEPSAAYFKFFTIFL